MLGALLVSVDVSKLGANEWTELSFWDGEVFGVTLGALEVLLPGKLDIIYLGFSVIGQQEVHPSPILNHISSQ